MRLAMMFVLVLAALSSGGHASDLTITVIEEDGTPVPAQLVRQYSPDVERPLSFMESGSLTFPEDKCEISTRYSVTPRLWSQFEKPNEFEAWKNCTEGPQLTFKFKRKLFKSAASNILASYDVTTFSSEGIASHAMQAVVASYWDGDYGGASYLAYEASASLAASGHASDARFFRELAVASTVDGIFVEEGIEDASVGIVYDSNQGMFVMSPAGQKQLLTWQASTGIEQTGKVDFDTIAGMASDPTRLWELRVDAHMPKCPDDCA